MRYKHKTAFYYINYKVKRNVVNTVKNLPWVDLQWKKFPLQVCIMGTVFHNKNSI